MPKTIRIGLQSQVLNARTSDEIDTAFVTIVRERADALFVAADGFFISRRVQFETLTAHDGIPATYADREIVEAGGLMSYGTDFLTDVSREMSDVRFCGFDHILKECLEEVGNFRVIRSVDCFLNSFLSSSRIGFPRSRLL